jgi:hypothetical protein
MVGNPNQPRDPQGRWTKGSFGLAITLTITVAVAGIGSSGSTGSTGSSARSASSNSVKARDRDFSKIVARLKRQGGTVQRLDQALDGDCERNSAAETSFRAPQGRIATAWLVPSPDGQGLNARLALVGWAHSACRGTNGRASAVQLSASNQQGARPGVGEVRPEPLGGPAALVDQQRVVLGVVHAPDDVGDLVVGQIGAQVPG